MRRTVRAACILALAFLGGCGQEAAELRLITPALPVDQAIAEQMVTLFGRESGIRITLVPAPRDGTSQLDALAAGYGDIAFASNTQPYRNDVLTVLPLYPTILHILVRIERVSDDIGAILRGAKIYAGPADSPSRQLLEPVMRDLGIGPEEVTYTDGEGEHADIVIVYAPISRDRVADFTGYRLMSFGRPDEIGRGSTVDRATLLNPRLTPFIIPMRTYADLTPEAVVTVAVDQLLVARSDLPGATVYDLVREIARMWPALSGNQPTVFHSRAEDVDSSALTFALHPGAQAYLDRDAPTLIERYSGVAEVLVTMLIGLVSGTYAAINLYRFRRKNRIDEFYKDVISIRNSVTKESTDAERDDAIEAVRALQNKAFDMLVHEKLAANDSFRIFITLANDSIQDLRDLPRDRAS